MKTTLTALQIEGNLLAPDMTAQMLEGSIKGQSPEDFGFNKTDKLADEIATAWGDAKAYWAAFQRSLARLDENNSATTITREIWAVPLLKSLGYDPVYTATAEVVEGQTYAISHRAEEGENKPPIHIIGCRLEVDKRPPSGTPRLSAHALVQEYLNKTEHLWAIATNGFRWRLLRDSSLMTRLTYIEFDLEQILNGENFAEFGLFYRLFHRSRLPEAVDDADKCLLEYYHQEALQQGGRVRDKLRDGVEQALVLLGNGFIQHPQNEHLRQKLGVIPHYETEITNYEFYRQLLRLIYRLLFLMVAESRNLLLIGDDVEKARIYREYYSVESYSLQGIIGFENERFLFSGIDHRVSFCIIFIGGTKCNFTEMNFSWFAWNISQANENARQVKLSKLDFHAINPNTFNCPIFRTYTDAELTKKIYQRVPIIENEITGKTSWCISFIRMFDMSNDSYLFRNDHENGLVSLYEAKMFYQFDHRYSTYEGASQADLNVGILPKPSEEVKQNFNFMVKPRYWVSKSEVENRLNVKWEQDWLLTFRSIGRSTNERTAIFSILPKVAVGHKAPIILIDKKFITLIGCLLANFNSLVFDFVTRQKMGGTDFSYFIIKQLPVIPPEAYSQEDIKFISTRVLELVYTAWDMQPFAKDMGYDGEPFIWNSNRRALLRAELDAYYAKLYGLNRDELRYILDPADVYGEDFPSETFRVLKNNEIKQFGEYRTQRLVLEAWDRMFM